MGFDINKFCSIVVLTLLFAIILFINLRICVSAASAANVVMIQSQQLRKEYQGDGCDKLKYINLNDDVDGNNNNHNHNNCPGEGNYAIAQQCLEYVECISSTTNSSTTYLLDYFQICNDGEYFNGTGCALNPNAGGGSGDDDCAQKHCRIIEISLENNPDEIIVTESSAGADSILTTDIDIIIDEFGNPTENDLNSTNSTSSSLRSSKSVEIQNIFASIIILATTTWLYTFSLLIS